MTNRTPLNVRVDEEVIADFREFTHDKKGKIRGEMGRLVEKALIEYMDNDRTSRLEADHERLENKLDTVLGALSEESATHAHKGNVSPTTVTEKAEMIAANLRAKDNVVFPAADVDSAIKDIAGASDRTLEKYRREVKEHGIYEHPSSDSAVWTVDKTQWAKWAETYLNSIPDADIHEMLEPYPINFDEYDRMVTEVKA